MHYLTEPELLLSHSSVDPTLKILLSRTGFAPRTQQTSLKRPWATGCGISPGSWNNGHVQGQKVAALSIHSRLCKRSAVRSSTALSVSNIYISHLLVLELKLLNRNSFSITTGTYELPKLWFKGCWTIPNQAHWLDLSRIQEPLRYPHCWRRSHTIGGTPVWEVLLGKDD